MIWDRAPFLRILLPFILGICLSELMAMTSHLAYWIGGIGFIVFALLNFVKPLDIGFKKQWVHGLLLNLILGTFGYITIGSQSNLLEESHFSNYLADSEQGILFEIVKPVTVKEKSVQAEVEVRQVDDENGWEASLGRAIIYFQRDSASKNIEVGDKCMAWMSLERVPGPRNPGVFDYAKYLSRKDIYYSAYIRSTQWQVIGRNMEFSLLKTVAAFRRSLEAAMSRVGLTEEAHAVISALTLGDKNELSQELKTAYSKAGVLHILAVSGLHVGIFYLVLNFLLGFLEKLKKGKYLKAVLVILGLWGYVMLTGMSPSVTRAATMFSFVVVGSVLHKHTNIYNTLCVSAFFLLLFQPQSLFNVGFLLSYSAVFGIVYLYPKIYGLYNAKYWLLDKIWILMSVSLAAQIITTPLSLHYFHQFPNYFLLANILVVPLATGIIYLALLLFILLPLQAIAEPIASIINFVISLLNQFVRWIESLPYAVTDNIEIGSGVVILLYLLIASSIMYLNTRRYHFLVAAGTIIVLLISSKAFDNYVHQSQQKLIVYDVPRHSAFDVIEGTTSMLTADSSLVTDLKIVRYSMEDNWRELGIVKWNKRIVEQEKSASILAIVGDQRIMFPLKLLAGNSVQKVKVDILILSKYCDCSIERLMEAFEIGKIVLDASVPTYRLDALLADCNKFEIPFYSVHKSGAFVQNY